MKSEDMEKLIKGLNTILEMTKLIDYIDKEEDADNDYMKGLDCPISIELQKDYEDILLWSFGKRVDLFSQSKGKAIELWSSLHPDLPIPRILKSKLEIPVLNTMALLIDVIPLYHKYKNSYKRGCKCDSAN